MWRFLISSGHCRLREVCSTTASHIDDLTEGAAKMILALCGDAHFKASHLDLHQFVKCSRCRKFITVHGMLTNQFPRLVVCPYTTTRHTRAIMIRA